MKDYVIDDVLTSIKREVVSLRKDDVVVYENAHIRDVSKILINQERTEYGALSVFLVSDEGKEIASIGFIEKLEIIQEGKVLYVNENDVCNENEGRLIRLEPQSMNIEL